MTFTEERQRARATATPQGIVFTAGARTLWSVDWTDIERVQAFKIDLITTDDICLEFVTAEGSYVLDEEVGEWDELLRELAARYRISRDWVDIVFAPAFATNRTVLWDRRVSEAELKLSALSVDPLWERCGKGGEIGVEGATVHEWNEMLAIVRGTFGFVEVSSGGATLLHGLTSRHFQPSHRAAIRFRAGDVEVISHCGDESRIALTIGPSQIQSGADLSMLLRLLVVVAAFLRKPVAFTTMERARFEADPAGMVQMIPALA